MKKSMIALSVFAFLGVSFISGRAWANETIYHSYGKQVVCAPQNGYIVQKRVVYRQPVRPVIQNRYYGWQKAPVRTYTAEHRYNGYQNFRGVNNTVPAANTVKTNNGNHFGWFNGNRGSAASNNSALTQDQRDKLKAFQEQQKTERKNFLDSLKS